MGTESRNPRSSNLDRLNARQIVHLMNEEEFAVIRALEAAEEPLSVAIEHAAATFQRGGRTIYLGSGTSGRVALGDAAEMPPTFGTDPTAFVALVSGGATAGTREVADAEDDPHAAITALNDLGIRRQDLVIGLAASGSTPFVLSGIRHARQKGVYTIGIANNKGSALLQEADLAIFLDTGPEVLTGSTRLKAGTSQKLALNRISTGAMVLSGKVIENLMVDVSAKNQKLKERCARIVRDLSNATYDEAYALLEQKDWDVRKVIESLRAVAVA